MKKNFRNLDNFLINLLSNSVNSKGNLNYLCVIKIAILQISDFLFRINMIKKLY